MSKRPIAKKTREALTMVAALAVLHLVLSGLAWASGDKLQGTYTSSSGKNIVLELQVPSPAPSSLIIQQFLPPGAEITSAQPEMKQFRQKEGVAKWLLTKVTPGRLAISLRLAQPLDAGSVWAEIRYRGQAGSIVQMKITP